MSVRSHIETAEESLRQALVTALTEKQDTQLSELFDALNKVKGILRNCNTLRITDSTDKWYNKMSEYNFNLSSDYLTTTVPDDTVISFGDTIISGSSGTDTISLG